MRENLTDCMYGWVKLSQWDMHRSVSLLMELVNSEIENASSPAREESDGLWLIDWEIGFLNILFFKSM